MAYLVTLINFSCGNACRHCLYGKASPVSYNALAATIDALMARGHRVHFYNMKVTRHTLALFRRTRQYEVDNPGWLNVNCDFAPEGDDMAYVSRLRTSLVVSLHGSSAARHAWLSGDEGRFDRIVEAIGRYGPSLTEPCASCDRREGCQGGCRATAMSSVRHAVGAPDVRAGFRDCVYHARRSGKLRVSGSRSRGAGTVLRSS